VTSTPRSPELRQSEPFWGPAQSYPQIWRTCVGIILVHIVFGAATFGIFLLGAWYLGLTPYDILGADTPSKMAVFFLTFIGYYMGLLLVLRYLHHRGFRTLFGPTRRVNWRHFASAVLIVPAITLMLMLIEALFLQDGTTPEVRRSLPFDTWVWLFGPALLLILMQIFAEELVFRGYLLQQLRARFRTIWLWAVLPSVIFGVMHFDQVTFGANAYLYVLHTAVTGIILAVITLRTGNIGAAAGLHFGNNAALLFMGNEGTLDGFSLYLTSIDLKGAYMSWSILTQTTIFVVVFALWWMFTQRHRPIANTAKAD